MFLPRNRINVSFHHKGDGEVLVPVMSFTGMPCATTVIVLVTTMVNVLYLISVGTAHSPSMWGVLFLRPPQFRNTLSIPILSLSTPFPP